MTIKGGAIPPIPGDFPFFTQTQGFTLDGPPRWYASAPLEVNNRRNGQKVRKGNYSSVVFHRRGSVQIYPYHMDWKDELSEWLGEWMVDDEVDMFFDYLEDRNGKHYTVDAPGVPRGYKFTIPGVGSFATDSTPFKKGTIEFEVDAGFDKRLAGIENAIVGQQELSQRQLDLSQRQLEATEVYAEGMRQHMKIIASLQAVVDKLGEAVDEMKEMRK